MGINKTPMKVASKNQNSKSFSAMIQLKTNLENGLSCSVATHNPEKLKTDFRHITGVELILEKTKGSEDIYRASLKAIL